MKQKYYFTKEWSLLLRKYSYLNLDSFIILKLFINGRGKYSDKVRKYCDSELEIFRDEEIFRHCKGKVPLMAGEDSDEQVGESITADKKCLKNMSSVNISDRK